MKTLNRFFCCAGVLLAIAFCLAADSLAQNNTPKIPVEVQAIAGTYTGSWASYTINDKGEVFKQTSWTDTITARKPTVAADRAYVEVTDEMTFEGGKIPPQKIVGKEGYLLNKDGSLGDYFTEFFGQTILMKKLGADVWVYTTPAAARDFMPLGDKFISATHVYVKTVSFDQGAELHHISRVTTVRWKDAEGKERTMQFVSLQGQHRKSK